VAGYAVKRIDEMEAAFGGAFRRARAELGARAFGFQVIDLPPSSGDLAPEHDHGFDGQEEVYAVLRGSGEIEIEGEEHAIDPETMVRVSPGVRRRLRSGPDGMRVLAIGGVPGAAFEPHPYSELGGPEELPDPNASSGAL
jgi:mannose-6-phosphate isomerase-like protein (cupin superfamily)